MMPRHPSVIYAEPMMSPAAAADPVRPVAVVTGASRGLGRGVARVLGEAGCVVYVTGRSSDAGPTTEGLPGTIERTAKEVDERGGQGIAVRCNHADETQVRSLFETVGRDHGRIDILVNNAWGGYESHPGAEFTRPLWQQEHAANWGGMFDRGLKATFLSSRHAAPLLMSSRARSGPRLVVNTLAWAFDEYLGNLYYDVAKAAVIRLTAGLARELAASDVAVVALAPGFVRTERVEKALAGDPATLATTESPEYAGRAVAMLAGDPGVMEKSGRLLTVGDLAREYHFADLDGRQPAAFRLA